MPQCGLDVGSCWGTLLLGIIVLLRWSKLIIVPSSVHLLCASVWLVPVLRFAMVAVYLVRLSLMWPPARAGQVHWLNGKFQWPWLLYEAFLDGIMLGCSCFLTCLLAQHAHVCFVS